MWEMPFACFEVYDTVCQVALLPSPFHFLMNSFILSFFLPPSNYQFVRVCDCDKLVAFISRSLSFLRL